MADETNTPAQTPDPISSFRTQYPGTQLNDSQIYGHISDPAKFRQVWPGTKLSDDEIHGHMQRYGLSRPDLQAPPSPFPARKQGATAPGAPTSTNEATGEGPIAATLTSAETQIANTPKGMGSFAKSMFLPGSPEWKAREQGNDEADKAGGWAPLTHALGKLNPIQREQPGNPESPVDIGATGVNLAPLAYGAKGMFEKGRAIAKPPLDTASASEEIHNAVNPRIRFKSQVAGAPLEEYPDTEFKANVQRQLSRIAQFAKDNKLNVADQESLAQAAQGAHHAQNAHFQENILGPSQNLTELTKDVPGYGGQQLSPGVSTLRQLYDRLSQVNAELDPKYRKAGGGGQEASAAVRSEAEAHAEAAALRNKIYTRLAHETGQTPQQVAEANQSVGELRSIAETTRREAALQAANENDLRNQKWGATNAHSLAQEALGRVSQRLQGSPVDARIAEVFKRLNVPGYSHVPIQSPIAGRAQHLTDLTNASQLGRVPVNTPAPAAALGDLPVPGKATPVALARGSQSSSVPEPIANILARLKPTQPTGESLTAPPFSYPYQQGEELGDFNGKQLPASEKIMHQRFRKSNPSALGDIPAPIKQALKAQVKAAETPKPPIDPEVAELRKKLEDLQKPKKDIKDVANPTRDTATLKQVQTEHPEWTLSQQLQEAAKRVGGKK